jgi:hypothetical protein
VSCTVINEASNGASLEDKQWEDGNECLMPAWVRADTLAVVGVVAPDDEAGEIAAGAIVFADVSCCAVMSQWGSTYIDNIWILLI